MNDDKPAEFESTSPDFPEWQARVAGTNINELTLLATDYLNHFNEIVMLLEMVPDMPDMLEECRNWQPKSYQDHFRDSSFSSRDLAVAAYEHAPLRYKIPFDDCIRQLNDLILQTVRRMEGALNEPELLRLRTERAVRGIQHLMDIAGAIIHASEKSLDQDEIDAIFSD